MDQDLRGDVRHRRGDRHHHGVRVRDELGDLLAIRRRHLRCSARCRSALRVLPRVDVPRNPALRPRTGLEALLLRLHLARLDRIDALGAVDHHRELLDADPGGLQDRRDRVRPQGRDDELLRGGLQPVHAPSLFPHSELPAHHRRVRSGRDRCVLPPQRRIQGLRPRGDIGRSDDCGDLLGTHDRLRALPGCLSGREPADQGRGDGGPLGDRPDSDRRGRVGRCGEPADHRP